MPKSTDLRCQGSTLTFLPTCPFGQVTMVITCSKTNFACPKSFNKERSKVVSFYLFSFWSVSYVLITQIFCALVPSSLLKFLPYTLKHVAVQSDSLRNKFHIYYKKICNESGTKVWNKPLLIFKKSMKWKNPHIHVQKTRLLIFYFSHFKSAVIFIRKTTFRTLLGFSFKMADKVADLKMTCYHFLKKLNK